MECSSFSFLSFSCTAVFTVKVCDASLFVSSYCSFLQALFPCSLISAVITRLDVVSTISVARESAVVVAVVGSVVVVVTARFDVVSTVLVAKELAVVVAVVGSVLATSFNGSVVLITLTFISSRSFLMLSVIFRKALKKFDNVEAALRI